MATKKISELQELETVNNNDLIPIVDVANSATKKATFGMLGAATSIPTGSIMGYDDDDGDDIPGGYEETDGPNDYSTTEKVIGKWIDGKPLYRKVVSLGDLPNSGNKDTYHNISDIDIITNYYGIAYNSNGNFRKLPFSADASNTIRMDSARTFIRVTTYSSWTGYTGYAILEYTKTTD